MSAGDIRSIGWRIPFWLAILIGGVGLYLRLRVAETPKYQAVEEQGAVAQQPLVDVFRHHKRAVVKVVGFTVSGTVAYYVFLTYFPSYASAVLKYPASQASLANTIGLLIFLATVLVFSVVSDTVGRRPILIAHAAGLLILTYPLLALLSGNRSFVMLVLVQGVGAFFMGLFSAAAVAAYAEMFPTRVRYSGISVPYNVAVAAFGGTAGFIATALVAGTKDPVSVSWFVIGSCVISLITYILMRETYRDELA